MPHSLDLSKAATYQEYFIEHTDEIAIRDFNGFPTARVARAVRNVKGAKTFTVIDVKSDMMKKWSCNQAEVEGAIVPDTVELQTVLAGITFKVCPQDIEEEGYYAYLRQEGQDPNDFPMSAWILEPSMESIDEQKEFALWQAVKVANAPAGSPVQDLFDGYIKIADDAGAAGEATVVPTGALTSTNILAKVNDVYAAIHSALRRKGGYIFLSDEDFEMYTSAFQYEFKFDAAYNEVSGLGLQSIAFHKNRKVTIMPLPGVPVGRILATRKDNLLYGFDGEMAWNSKDDVRSIIFWSDQRIGAQILLKRPGFLVINS